MSLVFHLYVSTAWRTALANSIHCIYSLETHEIVDGYELYKILEGDKETPKGFKSYEDYKKKEEAFIKHFCKGDKEWNIILIYMKC